MKTYPHNSRIFNSETDVEAAYPEFRITRKVRASLHIYGGS